MSNMQKKQMILSILQMFILVFIIVAVSSCSKPFNTVIYITDGNGTIEGATNQRVEYGGRTLSVTAIPNDGYRFVEWSDGIKTDTRSDRNITSNFTVTEEIPTLILLKILLF